MTSPLLPISSICLLHAIPTRPLCLSPAQLPAGNVNSPAFADCPAAGFPCWFISPWPGLPSWTMSVHMAHRKSANTWGFNIKEMFPPFSWMSVCSFFFCWRGKCLIFKQKVQFAKTPMVILQEKKFQVRAPGVLLSGAVNDGDFRTVL